MSREISPDRKSLYTLGMVVSGAGFLLFLSVFVTSFLSFGDFTDFHNRMTSFGFRALGGVLLLIMGTKLRMLAAHGPAGSGLVLDPEQARRDMEPWSRMSGGMTKDALDEMGVDVPRIVDALSGGSSTADAAAETFEQRLRSLHALHKDGLLTDEEYRREKQELLDGG